MSVYLITYDLNKKDKDYESLFEKIKEFSYFDTWWHYLDSTWIIKSNLSSLEISNKLQSVMDNNDFLLVIEVKNNYYGWLPEDAWDYLKKNIFN